MKAPPDSVESPSLLTDRRDDRSGAGMLALAALYIVIVCYGSFLPFGFVHHDFNETARQFVAKLAYDRSPPGQDDWRTNVWLYIPLGFLATGGIAGRRRGAFVTILAMIFAMPLCTATSLFVEFVQMWLPARTPSINDVYANSWGGALGALAFGAWWLIRAPLANLCRFSGRGSVVERLGLVYLLILVAASLFPGNFILSVQGLRDKFHSSQVCFVPFGDVDRDLMALLQLLFHAVSYAPIGFWLYNIGRAKSPTRSLSAVRIVGSLLASMLIVAGVECLQLFVYSRHSSATAIVTGTFGAACGIALAAVTPSLGRLSERRPWIAVVVRSRATWWLISLAYSLGIALLLLAPYQRHQAAAEIAERWHGLSRPPLVNMFNSSEFGAATTIAHKGVLFLALGAALVVCLHGRVDLEPHPLVTIAFVTIASAVLGLLIEIAKVYASSHYPDVTNIIIYAASAAFGAVAASHVHRLWTSFSAVPAS